MSTDYGYNTNTQLYSTNTLCVAHEYW